MKRTNSMFGLNSYGVELTDSEISRKQHRSFVGGLWKEIGELQFKFLLLQGLKPEHRLLDIGCGCLRGGVHYIKYLHPEHYYGLDVNESLIAAGKQELQEAGLAGRSPKLIVDNSFQFHRFCTNFDFMISVSLFTHLPMNSIVKCLKNAVVNLKPDGKYYSSFFESPESCYTEQLPQYPGGAISHYDRDPFHYSVQEIEWMASIAGFRVCYLGEWNHPRNQKMLEFTLR